VDGHSSRNDRKMNASVRLVLRQRQEEPVRRVVPYGSGLRIAAND
jgi:hypothetical protein